MRQLCRLCSVVLLFSVLAPVSVRAAEKTNPAVVPVVQTAPWAVKWWMPRHEQKLAEVKKMGDKCQLIFVGDSITHLWESRGRKVWDKYFAPRGAINLGFSGDRTEHVLWRLEHGEVDGIHPKLAVVMIGTNNTGQERHDPAEQTAAGVKAILHDLRTKLPDTKILLLAVFPRSAKPTDHLREVNTKLNSIIKNDADGKHIYWLNINKVFLTDDGTLTRAMMPDLLHPSEHGFELWAKAIEPSVKKLMDEK